MGIQLSDLVENIVGKVEIALDVFQTQQLSEVDASK